MIPLEKADAAANQILGVLKPYCELVSIAGSIRRRRPWVNDIDIVLLPKRGSDLPLRNRVKRSTTVLREGDQLLSVRLNNGVQLDLFLADQKTVDLFAPTPTNFGSLLLCRTGSKEHNIFLVEHAKKIGLVWNPHHGVFRDGELIASETEQAVFQALQLPFIEPEKRER